MLTDGPTVYSWDWIGNSFISEERNRLPRLVSGAFIVAYLQTLFLVTHTRLPRSSSSKITGSSSSAQYNFYYHWLLQKIITRPNNSMVRIASMLRVPATAHACRWYCHIQVLIISDLPQVSPDTVQENFHPSNLLPLCSLPILTVKVEIVWGKVNRRWAHDRYKLFCTAHVEICESESQDISYKLWLNQVFQQESVPWQAPVKKYNSQV